MSEWQEGFEQYIDCYVRQLTEGKEEFFLSFCDVEQELLESLDPSQLTEYSVIVVNNHDYAQAVKQRNTVNVCKIVLLSGEGVKQIDSLKDFNEYPVLAEDRKILWDCLEAALKVYLHPDVRSFLEVILGQSEITLSNLLKYLKKSMEPKKGRKTISLKQQKNKSIISGDFENSVLTEKLNQNLFMLGMWKSNKSSVLNKGETGRILRASKYAVVESRLTKAIMDNKISDHNMIRAIMQGLAAGDINSIFKSVDYESIKEFLKSPSRGTSPKGSPSSDQEDIFYESSYQYYLSVNSGKTVAEIETEWIESRKEEESEEEQERIKYKGTKEELERFERQCHEIEKAIGEMNLEEKLIQEMKQRFTSFQELFLRVWETVIKTTPICLDKFCESAAAYTDEYLSLLTFVLDNSKICSAVAGTTIVQMLQTLFCRIKDENVEMPFYHPICVFHDLCIRQMYQYAVMQQEKDGRDAVKDQIWMNMVQEAAKQFPIEYIKVDGREYVLDHNTVWQSEEVIFIDRRKGSIYSAVDFRAISRQILNYIDRHPFLTYIKIAVLDISKLAGLVQHVNRLLQLSQKLSCNIGRVEFLILSAREEELKKEMSQLWDSIGSENLVSFRFDRKGYWDGSQYQLKRLAEEFDMIIIADNSMLYREPRMVPYSWNGLKNRMRPFQLEKQVDRYFWRESCDMGIIWDSLQYVAENGGDGFWCWKDREIENVLLTQINHIVSEEVNKAVVLLSSNDSILSEIHRTQYLHVLQGGYNSKKISILEFENDNRRKQLPDKGEPKLVYSLKEFYEVVLGIDDIQEKFSKFLEDIVLEFGYRDGEFYCRCVAVEQELDDSDREWMDACAEWVYWQMKKMSRADNVLGIYFQDALLNCLLTQAENLPSVLLAERLLLGGFTNALGEFTGLTIENKKTEQSKKVMQASDRDCMEAMKLHQIVCFVRDKAGVDEQSVSQFRERCDTELLERLIKCNEEYDLLLQEDREKLQKIQEGIKG